MTDMNLVFHGEGNDKPAGACRKEEAELSELAENSITSLFATASRVDAEALDAQQPCDSSRKTEANTFPKELPDSSGN